MSFQFEPFKDQWLTFTDILDPFAECITYSVNLGVDFFTSLKLDSDNTLQYRINAAKASAAQLGTNPVLCLSGGVDSQAMIQCWQEAGLKFDVAIMEFENNLNPTIPNCVRSGWVWFGFARFGVVNFIVVQFGVVPVVLFDVILYP